MSKVKLIFGTHNAVPAGETEDLVEGAYQDAFKPFLLAVYNRPEMMSTLFFAGPLLEWLEKRHPEFHTVLAELTSKKTIEILGGGYWEPMLPLIPSSDRVGQIEVMTTYLRKKFGKRSRGSWINGQIWESHLASSLRSSGMDYAFLTERAFPQNCGFRAESPVVAEDQGKTVVIFPVMNSLTDKFLKVPPEHIVESIRSLAPPGDREAVVTLMLNGLALGSDGSHGVCYGEKWLERFFDAVRSARDWLDCVHPGKYLRGSRLSREKIYVPGSSYESLMRWTGSRGPADGIGETEDADGTGPQPNYRKFLTKYRESSLLYAKMMHVGVLTSQLRGDKYRKRNAKEELWRGQEHYAYWHGPSGGIYNTRLRHNAYGALIEAEKATRERGIFKSALTAIDFDLDGDKEFLYSGLNFNAYVHTVGGCLFELDYLPVSRNYLATCSRYEEKYHTPDLRALGYDAYPRLAFLDHVLNPGETLESFEQPAGREVCPFPGLRYTPLDVVRDQPRVSLATTGPVHGKSDVLSIQKTFRFRRNTLEVEYTLTNRSTGHLSFSWGTEINLALAEDADSRSLVINPDESSEKLVPDRGRDSNVEKWTVVDGELDVVMQFSTSEAAELWRFPVYADYRSGQDLKHCYQSSLFMPVWTVEIPPQEHRTFQIGLRIGRIRKQG